MKFGEYLRAQRSPEWQDYYLDYDKLKEMIKQLEAIHLLHPESNTGGKGTSLSVAQPTNAAGMPVQVQTTAITHEHFYEFLEHEMRKIEQFTKKQVEDIRKVLVDAEAQASKIASSGNKSSASSRNAEILRNRLEKSGEDFLKLEKYVNLNFTGFHKILKKHDRRLPNPCKAFYTTRLQDQSWVRGDYSDVIVTMSRVYSILRGDEELEAGEDATQNFVRSTRKYWVHTEDISAVKYTILQHLPVFLQNTMAGECDSQLVNSVYLDNHAMELYNGRLEKSPGAIALRFRWYGTGTPELVFVEQKTHRESWAGEVSVKERFVVKESQVASLLSGEFDVDGELAKLRAKGKSEEAIKEWYALVTEVIQAINSKQLRPTMRTQYMRTAFQIPFDPIVRVSLDTNLCMIQERTKATQNGERWFRDPKVSVPLNEITRFPHGVLEVKLQLEDESKTPEWVRELLDSGMLLEVHKFSKFIHGCSVLMPDDVRSVPYWIDDSTLKSSIEASGAGQLLETSTGANEYYHQLLPHDASGQARVSPNTRNENFTPSTGATAQRSNLGRGKSTGNRLLMSPPKPRVKPSAQELLDRSTISAAMVQDEPALRENAEDGAWFCSTSSCEDCMCDFTQPHIADHITVQKVEPKLLFANERTFISWLHMAVILSSISVGVLAFSDNHSQAQVYAVIMMPLSLAFIIYALWTYLWRGQRIKTRDANRWDDPYGPVILTSMLILAMCVEFFLKLDEVL